MAEMQPCDRMLCNAVMLTVVLCLSLLAADGGAVKLTSEEAAGQAAAASAEDLAHELQKQCSLVSAAAASSQVIISHTRK